jgi:tetratricopeptide (TPR) repeat protein
VSARSAAPLLLFALVAAVYLPSARLGFLYDDYEIILMQPAPRSVGDVARMFGEPHGLPLSRMPHYRAPTRATLLVQKALHGDRPGPFHVVNALLMATAALGVYAVLRHRRFGIGAVAAAIGAALFALHPAASSTVYPVSSGRETLLPVTFGLFAIAAHLRGGLGGRTLACLSFAVALLGKEQGIVLPVILVLADALGLTPDAPGRSPRAWALRVFPLLAIVVGYFALRAQVFGPAPGGSAALVLAHWRDNWWGPASSLVYALQSWFAPTAHIVYEPDFLDWLSPVRVVTALVAFGLLVSLAWRLPRADRPCVLWLLACIPVGMGATMRLLPQEAPYAERFLLLSSLGLVGLIALVGARAWADDRRWVAPLAAIVLIGCGVQTLGRSRDYADGEAFARRWVETSPTRANAHYLLGTALARRGEVAEALSALRNATRLAPMHAAAHYNTGVLLAAQGRRGEAAEEMRAALRADPSDAAARDALAQLEAEGALGGPARDAPRP